jgi:hypothetical protein
MPLDSKADNSKIARDRTVNVSSASVKNKVAVNRVVVSKGNDKAASLGTSERREITPAAFSRLKTFPQNHYEVIAQVKAV